MSKTNKPTSINKDYLINLIEEEHGKTEKHLYNIVKGDKKTLRVYTQTLNQAKSRIVQIISGDIANKQDLEVICEEAKKIFNNVILDGFKDGNRAARERKNNTSIVKRRIRSVQAKLNEEFNLPDIVTQNKIEEENINISPREKLVSGLKSSEMDEDISTFFAERMKIFLTYGLDSFYERVKKQVFTQKVSEESLIFIQRIFQYLYNRIEQEIINIDGEDLSFKKIQTKLKDSKVFQNYFNENKGKFCGDNKEKQRILDIFSQEIITCVTLIDSCDSLKVFLEQTLDEGEIPTSLEKFREIFVGEINESLSEVEMEVIREGYMEGLSSLEIVKNINSYVYGGLRKREEVDIFKYYTQLELNQDKGEVEDEEENEQEKPTLRFRDIQKPIEVKKERKTIVIPKEKPIKPKVELVEEKEERTTTNEIDTTLENIKSFRKRLESEVHGLLNLEALMEFQKKLQEDIDIHKENIAYLAENFNAFIERLNKIEITLRSILSPLNELQSDIESDRSAVQFALHTKDSLPKEQRLRIENLHESIQKYENLNNAFYENEENLGQTIDNINSGIRKYNESHRYLTSGVKQRLLGIEPSQLLKIEIPENAGTLDIQGLSQKIRGIQDIERTIVSSLDNSPISESLKRNVDKILKKPNIKKSIEARIEQNDSLQEKSQSVAINNNHFSISDIPDEVIKALKVLQVASPKPARGQNFGKTLKKLVGYLNISHGNYGSIDKEKETKAIIWLETQLDKYSVTFDEISRRPPTKAVLEKHGGFIIKWKFRNGSYMYLLPDSSMKQLDSVDIGDLSDTQKLFIRKKVEQEKEDNTQKYVKKSA